MFGSNMADDFIRLFFVLMFASLCCASKVDRDSQLYARLGKLEEIVARQYALNNHQAEVIRKLELKTIQQEETIQIQGETIRRIEETIHGQGDTIKLLVKTTNRQDETIQRQGQTIKRQEEAIKRQGEAIKIQGEAIRKQEERGQQQDERIRLHQHAFETLQRFVACYFQIISNGY
jgi:hypothetical protein